jgi:hypothetical protein
MGHHANNNNLQNRKNHLKNINTEKYLILKLLTSAIKNASIFTFYNKKQQSEIQIQLYNSMR